MRIGPGQVKQGGKMKKTIILWSLYTFSLAIANVLQANFWDPRDDKTDQVVGEEKEVSKQDEIE